MTIMTNPFKSAGFVGRTVSRWLRRADESVVLMMVNKASEDRFTSSLQRELGWAYGMARSQFRDAAAAYVRRYYRKHGRYPCGHHRFDPRSNMGAYFETQGAKPW